MAKMKDGHFEVSTHFHLTFIFVQEAMESFTSYDKINSIGGENSAKVKQDVILFTGIT